MQVVSAVRTISPQIPRKRYRRGIIPPSNSLEEQQKIVEKLDIHDPGYWRQWHLFNSEQQSNDINVTGVWQQNITGKGVVIALVDDGIDFTSEDIKDNFFAEGSHDYNDNVKLPMPRLREDVHGTRCAGEVAAVRNDVCGVGIAYNAKVAGIRILSKEITDVDEALSLNYGYQDNHIYSCSWGPPDDGQSMEGPHDIVEKAIVNGVENGRGGKGTVFVFASGNGGSFDDHCNSDGYTNSIYSITVGSIDRFNRHPYYSEACSAMMVVTYSSGGGSFIYTTDIGKNSCTERHGGTSAAAPLAAGIYALVLSVRPDLTWRDMQHLTVRSAIPITEEDESWSKTAAGWMHSNKFGFGKIDSYQIVEMAKTHQLVGRQVWIEQPFQPVEQRIPNNELGVNSTVAVTREMVDHVQFRQLEHITVTVNIDHQRRGDVEVFLISPNHIVSQLAATRKNDESGDGFRYWRFMTVKHWQVSPLGNWTLNVRDRINPEMTGTFHNWTMKLWGEGPTVE
ncbi:peptidase S8/S53 domain-containing protein, partial [Thamnocephalis sphaerospora]